MRTERIVVRFDVPLGSEDQHNLSDPEFWRQGIESMKRQADALAKEAGGYIDPSKRPAFTEPQKSSHAILGGDWLLWASMWYVEVPDHFVLPTSGQDSPDQPFRAT